MKNIYYILILILIIQLSCDDSSSIIDVNGNQLGNYGELHRDTLVAINDTFIVGKRVSTGLSPHLFLGRHNDFESRSLIKFNTLPADSITVDSLFLLIQSVSHYGESLADFNLKIKLVTESWDEKVNKIENWINQNSVSDEDSTTTIYTITSEDSLLHKIKLPKTLMSIWRDTTNGDQNHGIILDFENATYIKEFASENSTIIPKLVYVYQDSTNDSTSTTIRDTVGAAYDASIVEYLGDLVSDSLLYVTSGFTHYAFLKFNIDSIPENIVISNVNFLFTKDSLASDINKNKTSNFYFRTVTSPFEELPEFLVDSTFSFNLFHNVSLVEKEGDHIEIESTRQGETGQFFIQSLINKTINYGAFMLQYVGEGTAISVYALKGINCAAEANKPKMIIEYFKIPDSRL